MPTIRPVTAENMNYAIVFMAFILFCAAVFWYFGGKSYYTGPLIEAEIQQEEVTSPSLSENEKKEVDNRGPDVVA